MAVTVRLAAPRSEKIAHELGEEFTVDGDGNLVITAREGRAERAVAIYAAGTWLSAETD
jgi:hypothetical protein